MANINPQQLEKLRQTLLNIQSGLSSVQKKLKPLSEAEKAGMKITPQTTTEEASRYLSSIPKTPINIPNPNDYQQQLLSALNQQNQYLKNYMDTIRGQRSYEDVYKDYSEKLGLPEKQKVVAGIEKQVIDVENLLDKLESDINERISGKLVTEPVRRRYLATQGKPLREQLSNLLKEESRARAGYSEARQELADMLKAYQSDIERQKELAALPLEYGYKNIPYYKDILTYMSPEEKARQELRNKIATEEEMKKKGIGRYYQNSEETISSPMEWKSLSASEKSNVRKWIAQNGSEEDIKRAMEDPNFLMWVYQKMINEE